MGEALDTNQGCWFATSIFCKLGDEGAIEFWRHKWVGTSPLCEPLSYLFQLCDAVSVKINHYDKWNDLGWCLTNFSAISEVVPITDNTCAELHIVVVEIQLIPR